jgi:hypothetical protein
MTPASSSLNSQRHVFTESEDKELIRLVRELPLLWDSSHSDYVNNNKKSLAWKEIGSKMQLKPVWLRKRFARLRKSFKSKHKQLLTNGNNLSASSSMANLTPRWYSQMSFLADSVQNETANEDQCEESELGDLNLNAELGLGDMDVNVEIGDMHNKVEMESNKENVTNDWLSGGADNGLSIASFFPDYMSNATLENLLASSKMEQKDFDQSTNTIEKDNQLKEAERKDMDSCHFTSTTSYASAAHSSDVQPFLQQVEYDLFNMAADKRDYAKIRILNFLYGLKTGINQKHLAEITTPL